MTLLKHELRQGRRSLAVWGLSIAFLLAVCILLFPDMKAEMETASALFASMGSFTAAFGMDRLDFGTLTGFYTVECGNILSLGGAFYAALLGISALSKEEKEHTAEFLLTHPVSRGRVVGEKLAAALLQITVLNAVLLGLAVLTIRWIGEPVPGKALLLLHLACYLMQISLAGVCFGLSAFLRRGGTGLGLGLATLLYFLNLIGNMSESASFLKNMTPFGFCDGADLVAAGRLDAWPTAVWLMLGGAGAAAACIHYGRKDIR